GYSINEDQALNIAAAGVLLNDTDADSDPLTAVLVSDVQHGTLALNADGSFSYTPDADYNGPDSFTYKANDGQADSNTATVTVNISPVNGAPIVTSNSGGDTAAVSIAENTTAITTVMATDPDAGQTLSYSISGGADPSKITIGSSTCAPSFLTAPNFEEPTDADRNNVYDVTIQVSDGHGGIDTQAIAVTVTDVVENGPPVPAGTSADMILYRADGTYQIFDIGNNTILAAYSLGQVGLDW